MKTSSVKVTSPSSNTNATVPVAKSPKMVNSPNNFSISKILDPRPKNKGKVNKLNKFTRIT